MFTIYFTKEILKSSFWRDRKKKKKKNPQI